MFRPLLLAFFLRCLQRLSILSCRLLQSRIPQVPNLRRSLRVRIPFHLLIWIKVIVRQSLLLFKRDMNARSMGKRGEKVLENGSKRCLTAAIRPTKVLQKRNFHAFIYPFGVKYDCIYIILYFKKESLFCHHRVITGPCTVLVSLVSSPSLLLFLAAPSLA